MPREFNVPLLSQCFTLYFTGPIYTVTKTDNIKTKHNPGKANNTKHSKTKLPWFSDLIRHSARKQGGLILQCSRTHTETT